MAKSIICVTGIVLALSLMIFSIANVRASETACTVHVYSSETCTRPKICIYCGDILGTALGHNFVQEDNYYICTRCGIIYNEDF